MLNNAVYLSSACSFVFSAVNQEMMALIPLSDKRLRPRRTYVLHSLLGMLK